MADWGHLHIKHLNTLKEQSSFSSQTSPTILGKETCGKSSVNGGLVKEVFIPSKKDRLGQRFGFVRFKDVIDPSRMVANLNTIWLGDLHLKANFSTYNRNHQELNSGYQRKHFPISRSGGTRNGLSYAAVLKKCGNKDKHVVPHYVIKREHQRVKEKKVNEWNGISFFVDKRI